MVLQCFFFEYVTDQKVGVFLSCTSMLILRGVLPRLSSNITAHVDYNDDVHDDNVVGWWWLLVLVQQSTRPSHAT